jgi:hypothetical protein
MNYKVILSILAGVLFVALPLSIYAASVEKHPRIEKAIKALEDAKKELQEAPHDFGGHKADAVKACEDAVAQLKQALEYQPKHDKTGAATTPPSGTPAQ